MSEISEKADQLIDNFEYAVEDAIRNYTAANGAAYKNQARRDLEGYIADLEAEIAALKETLRWIPVSERLPELDQDVLAIVEGDIAIGHFYEQWDGAIYFSWKEVGAMQVATHWKPLPELPAEVQE